MPIGIMNDEVEKLLLSEGHNTALNRKAFREAAGRRWWCRGLSDTPLIRGSPSEVVVCTMKHADGDTMTHMLRLTAAWFRCAVGKREREKKNWTTQQRALWCDVLDVEICICMLLLIGLIWGKNELSLLISSPFTEWRGKRGRTREELVG